MTKTTPTLEGQTILVVGGSSGIGFGVALAALNNGASTVIVASSSSEKVQGACERLKAQAVNRKKDATVKGAMINAKDLDGVDKAVKAIGTINHLVWTSGDSSMGGADVLKGATSDLKGKPSFCRLCDIN
jgi:NAD(P)-dependent dehydrogenase (short-subunit alcohol dehydrogenase family)